MKISEALSAAADYINEYGWCQRAYGEQGKAACMIGAINIVSKHPLSRDCVTFTHSKGYNSGWNDETGRTQKEVTNKLCELADMARKEGV